MGSLVGSKWRIERLLGAGGAAVVYAARHRNGHPVAIKILRPELMDDPDLVARFTREGQIGNRVGHPGVVRTLDDGTTDDGLPFLVMDLLEGESLDRYLAREGRMPEMLALSVVDQMLDALAAAHACGLVHRDIKPENVFLSRGGGVKLLDFGIAGGAGPVGRGVTVLGSVLGTPAFMPPEQARGHWNEVDERSDLWSVGATLFMMLTGRYLHRGESVTEELIAATEPVAPMRALAPELEPSIAASPRSRARAFTGAPVRVSHRDETGAARGVRVTRRRVVFRPGAPLRGGEWIRLFAQAPRAISGRDRTCAGYRCWRDRRCSVLYRRRGSGAQGGVVSTRTSGSDLVGVVDRAARPVGPGGTLDVVSGSITGDSPDRVHAGANDSEAPGRWATNVASAACAAASDGRPDAEALLADRRGRCFAAAPAMRSTLSDLLLARVSPPVAESLAGMAGLENVLRDLLEAGQRATGLVVAEADWIAFLARHLEPGSARKHLSELPAADVCTSPSPAPPAILARTRSNSTCAFATPRGKPSQGCAWSRPPSTTSFNRCAAGS